LSTLQRNPRDDSDYKDTVFFINTREFLNKNNTRGIAPFVLFFRELVFAYSADGAYPILGEFFKRGSGCYAVVGIAYGGIILVSADFTYVLTHNH
jgi:hypothetical protein